MDLNNMELNESSENKKGGKVSSSNSTSTSSSSSNSKFASFKKEYAGMALTLMTCFLLSIDMVCVTMLIKYGIEGQNAAFFCYFGMSSCAIPILIHHEFTARKSAFTAIWPMDEKERRKNLFGVISRGFCAPFGATCRFYALKFMPMGDVAVVASASPILVSIIGHFWLKEKTGVIPILSAVVGIFGVLVLSKPPILTGLQEFDHNNLIGLTLALVPLIGSAYHTLITRNIRTVSFALTCVADGILGMIITFILSQLLDGFAVPHGMAILLVCAVAVVTHFCSMCHIYSCKMETAEVVALVGISTSVFAFLLQMAVFQIIPDRYSILGALLIILSIFIVALRKYLLSLSGENRKRKVLSFLLI